MTAQERTSRRQSDANSTSRWPRDAVIFTDKCLGNHDVPDALKALGLRVELLTDHFHPDTEDCVWLEEVGKRKWIVLSKDRHLHTNYLQLIAMLRGNVKAFALKTANAGGEGMAKSFVLALPSIFRFVERVEAPFLARVGIGGTVEMIIRHSQIFKKISDMTPPRS